MRDRPDSPKAFHDGYIAGWASGFLAASGERPWSLMHMARAEDDYRRNFPDLCMPAPEAQPEQGSEER